MWKICQCSQSESTLLVGTETSLSSRTLFLPFLSPPTPVSYNLQIEKLMNPERKKHKIHITSRLVWLYFKNQIRGILAIISSVQFSLSVLSKSCDPMDCSALGFPVHNELPELTQTHVHRVGDAIQPSHPLSSPSPPAFSLSQNQSLFQEVSYLHHVAKVLEFHLQHQAFQWTFRTDFLWD